MTAARRRRLRVFITGASSGIGAALAREYAARGAILGLLGRRADALHALPFSAGHHIYTVDVTDHAALAAAAFDFIAREGGADIVIASAGVSAGTLTERPDDLSQFARIFAINVTATVATFAPFVETMKRREVNDRGPRRLVAIGSVAGIRGMKGAGAYCASKSAVHTYAESLRLELQPHGIRVVTIAPGYIDTPMTRQNRFPMPFLMPVDRFAAAAARAIDAGTSYRVIPWPMGVVAKVLRLLPNVLFDALFAHAPTKSGKAAP